MKWLNDNEAMSYSKELDGVFCLACILFPVPCLTGSKAEVLLSKPFSNWKHAENDLEKHSLLQYHLDSVARMTNFMDVMKRK